MKRIVFAFLMALVGIGLSWIYLKPTEWSSGPSSREAIARVVELRNDVTKQEEGRLLWSPVRKGDQIFLGDKIKTSGLSSTVIQFIQSASKLELEENSVIVMAQKDKKLALNMLEGRVFLQQTEGNVDLLSGGKKLEVTGDSAVSVSPDGNSEVQSFQRQQSVFSDLTPVYSADILSGKNEVFLNWQPSARKDLVEVLVGESPMLLKKLPGIQTSFDQGKLEVPFKPGLNYWQLVVNSSGSEQKSSLMKLNLTRPLPPNPIYPADKELIRIENKPFDFKWIKGNTGDSVVLEISQQPNFQKVFFTQEVKDQTYFSPPAPLSEGNYFWRVRSRSGPNDWVESKANAFTMHQGNNFLSPTPLLPQDNSVFYLGINPGNQIKFEWRRQEPATGYNLKIIGEGFERVVPTSENSVSVALNRSGKYTWQITSLGPEGRESINPSIQKLEIREQGRIRWLLTQKEYLYAKDLPILILRWEKNVSGPNILRISATADMKESETFQAQGNDFPYRVLRPGLHFVQVSGLDEIGEVTAESAVFDFNVKEAPLPPAPIVIQPDARLKTTASGEMNAPITNGKPGWFIIAQLNDISGRLIDERRFPDQRIKFSGLLPGKYILQTKFEDEYKRFGDIQRTEVEVPEKSTIAAPKIKGINVR